MASPVVVILGSSLLTQILSQPLNTSNKLEVSSRDIPCSTFFFCKWDLLSLDLPGLVEQLAP